MDTLKDIMDFVIQTLLAELLVVAAGVLFARFVQSQWDEWRYGKWRVLIQREGETILDRGISARKAKEILEEPADLSVFLKGTVSPYAFLNCDIIEEGTERGLLVKDEERRIFVVNLDENPLEDNHKQGPV